MFTFWCKILNIILSYHQNWCYRTYLRLCNMAYFAFIFSEKLTNPAFSFDGGREAGFLKRSSSNSSLNSLFSTEGDPHLRVCEECRKLLERRDQMVEQRNTKPTIVVLYEVLLLTSVLVMIGHLVTISPLNFWNGLIYLWIWSHSVLQIGI